MKNTGGSWDPNERPIYFSASNGDTLIGSSKMHPYVLCAVNELEHRIRVDQFRQMIDDGCHVFLDSGVFNLANTHAKTNSMRMDVALGMAPEEIDGFDELFEHYVKIVGEFKERLWGYIEIDQGGRDNKRRTRARLEALGLAPIPVYHPLNDGWEYFDELASQYDRICFGNVVQADAVTRKRLLATAWERRRSYPRLWIHLLGVTPSEITAAFPLGSCDSSTFCSLLRWPDAFRARTMTKALWGVDNGVAYDVGSDPLTERGHQKARALAGYDAAFTMRIMRQAVSEYERVLDVDHKTPAALA